MWNGRLATVALLIVAGIGFSSHSAAQCVLTCPANITLSAAANQCGATVNYSAPQTSGTCGTVTASPASGAFYPVGTTTVNASASGAPQPTCSFTITVNDTQPPSVTAPANITIASAVIPAIVNFAPASSTDNCPGVNSSTTPPSGSAFPAGQTTVTTLTTDASNNTASASFVVTVVAILPPEPIPGLTWFPLAVLALGVGGLAAGRLRRRR